MALGYQVWSEGFVVNEGRSTAMFRGIYEGQTFDEACEACFGDDPLFDKDKLTYYACHLYPDERRARASYG